MVFHRAKAAAKRGGKVIADQPELSINDPELSNAEKLSKVRVQTLVREYLAAQELQLLGESGMSDAIETFVDKDDIHAIQNHVNHALKSLMKGVQANGEEVEEENIDDIVEKVREKHDKEYVEKRQDGGSSKSKGKGKATNDESDVSADSMMMDVDAGGSDFEELESDPAPKKKARAPAKKATAPAKKAPAKGRGKKKVQEESDDEDEDEIEEEEEAPKPKRTNRAAVLSQSTTTRKAPAKKATTAKQATLSFAPSGRTSTRAAASRASKKVAQVMELDSD